MQPEKADIVPALLLYLVRALARCYMVTQELLKEYFHYEPLSGIFTAIKKLGPRSVIGKTDWYINDHGYRKIKISGQYLSLHRLAWLYVNNEYPQDEIDHINGDRLDNRIANLRVGSKSQNQHNRKTNSNSKTKIKGVCWHKRDRKWMGQVQLNGKKHHLGLFDDIKEAELAVMTKREELHKQFCNHG